MTKRSRRTVAVKGSRRVRIVNTIADHLTGDLFLKKLNWRKATEQRIKLALHPDLQAKVQQIYENVFGYTEGYANEQYRKQSLSFRFLDHRIGQILKFNSTTSILHSR